MQLTSLLDRLKRTGLLRRQQGACENIAIDCLADDSQAVGADGSSALFVAIRGTQADGHLFIDNAVENGAVAVLCEAVPEAAAERFPGTCFVQVGDARAALAEGAAAFYGDPSHALRMVGITGTNGKTTTAFLVQHLLEALGARTGLLSTVAFCLGGEQTEASLTTPGPLALHRMLRKMLANGCTACAMEVSSHALAQDRVRATHFDVGVFTNLTLDHLDYHASLGDYRAAKRKLFEMLPAGATALYNLDDEAGPFMVHGTAGRPVAYGQSEAADVRVEVLENRLDGLRLRLDGAERAFRLVGRFNAYNLAAAYGVGRALGYGRDAVIDALAEAPPVPGRFEQLHFEGAAVVVDYAHTPDALENVLRTLADLKPPQAVLWCVFGCGGDRDRSKRGPMGRIAERHADRVIVTSDNPRIEKPEAILADIRRGMQRPAEALFITDRRAAIHEAARRARRGDVVLIAGKGHETYQIIGTTRRPFDDREVARRFFGTRNSS